MYDVLYSDFYFTYASDYCGYIPLRFFMQADMVKKSKKIIQYFQNQRSGFYAVHGVYVGCLDGYGYID